MQRANVRLGLDVRRCHRPGRGSLSRSPGGCTGEVQGPVASWEPLLARVPSPVQAFLCAQEGRDGALGLCAYKDTGFVGPGPHACALSCHYPGKAPVLNAAEIEVKISTWESAEGGHHGHRQGEPPVTREASPRAQDPDAGLTFPAAGCAGCCSPCSDTRVPRALLSVPASGWGAFCVPWILVSKHFHTHTNAHTLTHTLTHTHTHSRAAGPEIEEVLASHGTHPHSQLMGGLLH